MPNSEQGNSPIFRVGGPPATAAELNWLVDQVAKRFSGTRGLTVQSIGGSILITPPEVFPIQPFLTQMEIVTVEDDYLTCFLLDANDDADTGVMNVMKPFTLRKFPFATVGSLINGSLHIQNHCYLDFWCDWDSCRVFC